MTESIQPKPEINLDRIMSLSREQLVEELEQGLTVEVITSNGNFHVTYLVIERADGIPSWRLSISDEQQNEFAYYELQLDGKEVSVNNKIYHRENTVFEGIGLIKIGFSLLVEYFRHHGFKQIKGTVSESDMASRKSRENAIDLTKGGTFASSTKYKPLSPETTNILKVTTYL